MVIRLVKLALPGLLLLTLLARAAYESDAPVDFSLQQLHGHVVSLADYRQQWVVLNYWATWCAPCRKEIPDLSALHEARGDITVLGLAYEDTDLENFDAFLAEFKPSYPILLVDVYAPPEPFGAPKALPTTVILDPQGYPVKTYLGPVTRETIETFIDAQ
ncbi:MAG: TlpA family protein disulfide reductase [Xanthomonadales bacterium]|nr:TlpA family protein disulfide reductase [Xanthomonadales bacterium]